jgi:spermidine synthase
MPLGLLYVDTYERAAFIGLGGGRTASYIIRTIPEINLDVAAIDKEVIRLAKKYFNVEESERLKIVAEDGRVFLTRSKEKYDIVFLDAYRGPFVPFHLLTKEFFQLIKSKMKEGGVVVQNVEPSTMLLDSALRTIGSVFPQVDTFSNSGNVVVIGYNSSKLTHDQIRKKAEEFDQKYKPLYSTEFLLKFRKDMGISDSAKVLTDDFAPVEMLNTIKRHNQKWQ